MKKLLLHCSAFALLLTLLAPARSVDAQQPERLPKLGTENRPDLPDQPWRVHDWRRPRPDRVEPGQNGSAPSDAIVLFDGTDLSQWCHEGKEPGELLAPQWTIDNGELVVAPGKGTLRSIENFGDVQLHIEWSVPEGLKGDSQGRGNSGIKFMTRYEVQVLDSFNNRTYADGQAGALYGQWSPLVNASLPPGQWQTYDIVFEMPRFDDGGELESPACVTVFHNGILIHHRRELYGPTGAARAPYRFEPPAGPIILQDHGNPIRYRNIWARRLDLDDRL